MKLRFIYRGLKARYRDERCELQALTSALTPNDIAVDVGANKGGYLWALSRAVPHGRVVAFEPQPNLADYLKKACRASGLNNVTVESAGVSDHSGSLTLAIPGDGDSSPGASFEAVVRERESCRTVDVPILTLDDYFKDTSQRIGAIKIDVEGHELAVLRGARQILARHAPVIVCECESRHITQGSVQTVLDYFRELHYDGTFVQGARQFPISEFDPAIHQRQNGDRYWDSPDYCNNFIMRKVG